MGPIGKPILQLIDIRIIPILDYLVAGPPFRSRSFLRPPPLATWLVTDVRITFDPPTSIWVDQITIGIPWGIFKDLLFYLFP